jgi:hypothetical protein
MFDIPEKNKGVGGRCGGGWVGGYTRCFDSSVYGEINSKSSTSRSSSQI